MRYAEVSVNSPVALRRTFSYSIPQGLAVKKGQAVWVPFGERLLQGVVFSLTDNPAYEETRDIAGIIQPEFILSSEYLELAAWISSHYLCPLFSAVSLMLPPGYDRKAVTFITTTVAAETDLSTHSSEKTRLIEILLRDGKTALKSLEKEFGQRKARQLVTWLVNSGHGKREYGLEAVKARPRYEMHVSISQDGKPNGTILEKLKNSRKTAQVILFEYLMGTDTPIPAKKVLADTGCSRATLNALVRDGLVVTGDVAVRRDPLASHAINISYPLTLTAAQEQVLQPIIQSIGSETRKGSDVFLLYGVTGSGKTEIYLQALAEAVKNGKRGIVMVPEISLTPQTIERFSSRFPGKVAVLHSRLSMGEKFDEWQRIQRGDVDVVIGPRSAVFAPQPELGLIIMDEEHEWTYKQQDTPRYHARDVAVKLAESCGATVILGSATPDIESYYQAETGNYHLLELPARVTPYENAPLPSVEIVDLRTELKSGNRSMFSRSLSSAVKTAVAGHEQVLLFLNRRGSATYIQCRDCGFVLRCSRCDVPFTYHLSEDMLVCHQCNRRTRPPDTCPQCGSRRIKYLGAGTQKLEEEAREAFPNARLLRWDSDTTVKKDAHKTILEKFRDHKADILIGTQMITKGLDLPLVTLVGVVSSDTALNLPDFRAGERTFQLLSQVAGRAGRGPLGGQVIIQTYTPDHYAVQAASRHDYEGLYRREIEYRKKLNYPPFTRLASLVYAHSNDDACRKEAERMKGYISDEIAKQGVSGMSMIGPAPAFIHRLRGRYRWQIILRGTEVSGFLSGIALPNGWTIDIDPVGL